MLNQIGNGGCKMGSFLVRCGVTNQTIQEKEEVVIVPVVENKRESPVYYKDSFDDTTQTHIPMKKVCYATDRYTPLGYIFKGYYEDYGLFNLNVTDNSQMLKSFIKYIKRNCPATFTNRADETFDIYLYRHEVDDLQWLNEVSQRVSTILLSTDSKVTISLDNVIMFGKDKELLNPLEYFQKYSSI